MEVSKKTMDDDGDTVDDALRLLKPPPEDEGEVVAVQLSLECVLPSPFQPRQRAITKKEVEELMASISANGQTAPIIVSPALQEGEGKYHVQSGHRRCAALKYLGAWTVRAIVKTDLDERGARKLALADNLGRADLSAYEQAMALKDFCERYELSVEDAGKELGIKRAHAFRLANLLNASAGLVAVLRETGISARSADLLSRLDKRDSKKAVRMAEKLGEGRVSAKAIAEELTKLKQSRGKKCPVEAAKIELKTDGDKIQMRVAIDRESLSETDRERLKHAIARLMTGARIPAFDPTAWQEMEGLVG